ncbi:MAG: FadR family transcriptional regulator [Clostridiaceae bacterium]|jgi:DNA-binding FadR family transcriptional regulator|nr:FadR family transcriptional regulator [Clostridiaceae bacterium]
MTETDAKKGEKLLDPMDNRSVVDRIIARITNAIISGELLPGQKIPTESELCESMHVGRNSVREAIKVLVAMGVLYIKRAEGTFVAEGFSDRMLDPMVYGLILEGGNTRYLIELRRMLDVGVLNLAIQNATDEDIEKLKQSFAGFCETVRDNPSIDEILDADIKFHRTLEKAVHNPLVEKICNVVERLSRATRARATEQFLSKKELDRICELHQRIIDALENRDEAAVSGIIDDHYQYWKDEVR